jgi:hypothetical protein
MTMHRKTIRRAPTAASSIASARVNCRPSSPGQRLDTVSFGITADYDAVPDVDVLVQGIRRGLAELGGQPQQD